MSAAVDQGVLLALSGDDAPLVRSLDATGSGLRVVRRCADLPELLSAGLAGLAYLAVVDAAFADVDRTVLDRLGRAGMRGVLLVPDPDSAPVLDDGWVAMWRGADPQQIRSRLQGLVRQDGALAPPASARPGDVVTTPTGTASPPAPTDPWVEQWEETWRTSVGDDDDIGGLPWGGSLPGGPAPGRLPAGSADGRPGQGGRLVVVWGPHGAPGRTTVAASLAHGLARGGQALLVDADLEAPSLVQVLGMPEDSSALATAARLATHARLDAEAFERILAPAGPGTRLLSGLGRGGRWRELPPASMAEVWRRCRQTAPWTVVDVAGGQAVDDVDDFTLEPGRTAMVAALLKEADVVVVVGAGDPVGVRRLIAHLADAKTGTWRGRVEVVVNRVRASVAGPSPERAVREALGRFGGVVSPVLLPDDQASADRCLLEGSSVLEGAPGSALGAALAALVDRVDPGARCVDSLSRSRRGLWRRRGGGRKTEPARTRDGRGGRGAQGGRDPRDAQAGRNPQVGQDAQGGRDGRDQRAVPLPPRGPQQTPAQGAQTPAQSAQQGLPQGVQQVLARGPQQAPAQGAQGPGASALPPELQDTVVRRPARRTPGGPAQPAAAQQAQFPAQVPGPARSPLPPPAPALPGGAAPQVPGGSAPQVPGWVPAPPGWTAQEPPPPPPPTGAAPAPEDPGSSRRSARHRASRAGKRDRRRRH